MEYRALSLFERGFLDEVERRRASGRGINSLFYLPPPDVMTSVPMEDLPDGYTALYFAAQEGLSAAITPLLENGADVHTGLPSNPETPLRAAARSNRDNIAAVLLDAGARVDDRDSLFSNRAPRCCQKRMLSRTALQFLPAAPESRRVTRPSRLRRS